MNFYAVFSINRIQIFKSYLKALKIGKYIDLHYRFHLEPYSSKLEYQIATTPISCKLSYIKVFRFFIKISKNIRSTENGFANYCFIKRLALSSLPTRASAQILDNTSPVTSHQENGGDHALSNHSLTGRVLFLYNLRVYQYKIYITFAHYQPI